MGPAALDRAAQAEKQALRSPDPRRYWCVHASAARERVRRERSAPVLRPARHDVVDYVDVLGREVRGVVAQPDRQEHRLLAHDREHRRRPPTISCAWWLLGHARRARFAGVQVRKEPPRAEVGKYKYLLLLTYRSWAAAPGARCRSSRWLSRGACSARRSARKACRCAPRPPSRVPGASAGPSSGSSEDGSECGGWLVSRPTRGFAGFAPPETARSVTAARGRNGTLQPADPAS